MRLRHSHSLHNHKRGAADSSSADVISNAAAGNRSTVHEFMSLRHSNASRDVRIKYGSCDDGSGDTAAATTTESEPVEAAAIVAEPTASCESQRRLLATTTTTSGKSQSVGNLSTATFGSSYNMKSMCLELQQQQAPGCSVTSSPSQLQDAAANETDHFIETMYTQNQLL